MRATFPRNDLKRKFSKKTEGISKHLRERRYAQNLLNLTLSLSLSEIQFENKKKGTSTRIFKKEKHLPFVTQNQPSVPGLKSIFMKHRQLIENQLLLRQIDKEPPIISPKPGKSLKDILVL